MKGMYSHVTFFNCTIEVLDMSRMFHGATSLQRVMEWDITSLREPVEPDDGEGEDEDGPYKDPEGDTIMIFDS